MEHTIVESDTQHETCAFQAMTTIFACRADGEGPSALTEAKSDGLNVDT